MSIPLSPEAVTITHADSNQDNQIYMAAEAIWGIESDHLPQAKFEELRAVLVGCLERRYGPCLVKGFGNTFVIFMDRDYEKKPCSLPTCMVTDAAHRCSRCMALYCSREHQKAHWDTHKHVCIKK
jgi:hypothetical protein